MWPSLTSLCLSIPCLDICGSLSSPNVQPTHRVAPGPNEAIALPKATHPSDPYYLESHGYGYEELASGSFGIYNERDDPEYPELLVDNLTPGSENTPVSLIDKQAAELAAERDLNAAIEDSGNARQAELEAILKTNSDGCSSTSSRESGGEASLETAPGPISESI
ncbi:hypothetical protein CFIMG_006508RA [Ceratocystis fimbriata CBS 114723]|uniref:Uncharacterized protein n=1 Tax=Ceratocystis fimbriata CBS 114723 TaxID=1035309 RepID=A0A2C5WVN1_9PEZI|nr:hypothetical protein CFIMG_006508RA [Ceratocystis fimbriata CBS 114723]